MNNIESKRESKYTNLMWFDNVTTFTDRWLYFFVNNSGLHNNKYIEKTLNPNSTDIF